MIYNGFMSRFFVLIDYLSWHYGAAYADIVHIARNYLWFVNHVFSLTDVSRNLFSPFKRMQEDRVNIVRDPSAFFANLTVNILMRIVGFVLRMAIVFMTLIMFALILLLTVAVLVLWTILPGLIAYLFVGGVTALFS